MVLVDLGKIEAMLPAQEQVPGEDYVHGQRLRVVRGAGEEGPAAPRSRCRARTPAW